MWYVAGMALGAALLALLQYVAYARSRSLFGRVYGVLADRWGGTFLVGSFFVPPSLSFRLGDVSAELRSFYLYRGDTGHYTQFVFRLPKAYLHAFEVRPGGSSGTGYAVESARPSLVEDLLAGGWSLQLQRIDDLTGKLGCEVRFDGDTLLVRKKALLLAEPDLVAFRDASEGLLQQLCASLDRPVGPAGAA